MFLVLLVFVLQWFAGTKGEIGSGCWDLSGSCSKRLQENTAIEWDEHWGWEGKVVMK